MTPEEEEEEDGERRAPVSTTTATDVKRLYEISVTPSYRLKSSSCRRFLTVSRSPT